MKRFSLDSVLLLALIVPYIMTYGLGAGETPFVLFGLIFLSSLMYIVIDLLNLKEKLYGKLKLGMLFLIVLLVLGSSFQATIIKRHTVAPIFGVHDIILQQESAIRYFLDGKNPYKETYFSTPLEEWHYSDTEVNPALYHYVMQPWYHLFPLPFMYISNRTIGYFDARIPLFLMVFVSLVVASMVVKDQTQKRLFVVLLAFNPAMLGYTLEGRSDMFMYGFLILALYLLYRKQLLFGSMFLALSFAVKQSIWPLFPFYFVYLWFQKKDAKQFLLSLIGFSGVFLGITLPFFLWDQEAFLNSTVLYLSGQTEHAYPISGYGLGVLLHQLGFIENLGQYYPFIIWQVVFCLPLLCGLLYYVVKRPTMRRMILAYGIFLFVYWYMSRYFNNSHLGYLSVVFITAYFWPEDSKIDISGKKVS